MLRLVQPGVVGDDALVSFWGEEVDRRCVWALSSPFLPSLTWGLGLCASREKCIVTECGLKNCLQRV